MLFKCVLNSNQDDGFLFATTTRTAVHTLRRDELIQRWDQGPTSKKLLLQMSNLLWFVDWSLFTFPFRKMTPECIMMMLGKHMNTPMHSFRHLKIQRTAKVKRRTELCCRSL